jgi:hypothetical protein
VEEEEAHVNIVKSPGDQNRIFILYCCSHDCWVLPEQYPALPHEGSPAFPSISLFCLLLNCI